MIRGGSGLRRRLLTLALIACGVFAVLPAGLAAAATSVNIKAGDAPGGPPSVPAVGGAVHARVNTVNWSDLCPPRSVGTQGDRLHGRRERWMRDFPQNPTAATRSVQPDRDAEVLRARRREGVRPGRDHRTPSSRSPICHHRSLLPLGQHRGEDGMDVQERPTERFLPDKPVTMTTVHKVLVLALGMRDHGAAAERAAHQRRREVRHARQLRHHDARHAAGTALQQRREQAQDVGRPRRCPARRWRSRSTRRRRCRRGPSRGSRASTTASQLPKHGTLATGDRAVGDPLRRATPTSGQASGASPRPSPPGWVGSRSPGSTARASRGGPPRATTAASGRWRRPRPYVGWQLCPNAPPRTWRAPAI